MEFNTINQLLEKYWNGESSLEEEKILKTYFQQTSIAEEHQAYAPLFQYFQEEQTKTVSDDFEEKLLQQLSSSENSGATVVALPNRSRRLSYFLPRIAAALALCISIWFLLPKPADPTISEVDPQEVEEAKIAYKQAKAALVLLSVKLNKGTNAAVNGLHEFDKATKVVRATK